MNRRLAFLCLLLAACTKADALVVVHTAADACQVVELATEDRGARAFCLAVEELDRLLEALLSAQRAGRGVEVTVRAPDGAEERLVVSAPDVPRVLSRVSGARARAGRP